MRLIRLFYQRAVYKFRRFHLFLNQYLPVHLFKTKHDIDIGDKNICRLKFSAQGIPVTIHYETKITRKIGFRLV